MSEEKCDKANNPHSALRTPNPTILIVEDSAIQAEMLRRLLSQEGYTVTIAKNGREGLAIAQQQKMSLILSDINMPEMDGYQMCYKIKQDERLRDVPVLLLTELTDPGDVIRGLIAGADNYITKPFNEKLLLSMLDAMLSSARVPKKEKTLVQLEVTLEGERQVITIDSERVLNLLLSTYKNTILQNKAIIETQEKLREINKQLEDKFIEITASENRFKTFVQTIPDIVYRIDNNGNFVYVNYAVHRIGYEPQELIGRHFSKIILPADVSNVSWSLILPKYKGIATGEKNAPKLFDERRTGERKTKNLEVRLLPKGVSKPKPGVVESIGEEVIPVEINSAGLYATAAKAEPTSFIGTVGVIRDITERKMAEETRNQLVAIIEATPDIVVTTNTVEGNMIFMNEAGYRVLGIQKDEDVSHLHLQDILPSSVRTSVLEKGIPTAIREGYWNDECLLLSRSGRTIQVLLVIIAHKKADGTVSRLSTIARDITELKQHEEKLLDMNADLERRVAERTAALVLEIKDHEKVETELNKIEWILHKSINSYADMQEVPYAPVYGDLTGLNTSRLILDSVGRDMLSDIVHDYLDLMETSSAVYEKNGDYALGIFTSGWCRFLDTASRKQCGAVDDKEALEGGKWLCHESCWSRASRVSIETGQPADIECQGVIRLYAVPIRAGGEIVGSINVGYGDPPKDHETLQKLAEKFTVSIDDLQKQANLYEHRPAYIIEMAKKRLHTSAKLIGEIVQRKQTENKLHKLNEELEQRVIERTAQIEAVNRRLEATNKELESFSYSVSHDLRAPLRAIDGFSRMLVEDFAGKIDAEGQRLLNVIRSNAQKMGQLIDDLLSFSRMGRHDMVLSEIDMTGLARSVFEDLKSAAPERIIQFSLKTLAPARGDLSMIRQVWVNLISNAIKFTRPRETAVIEVGSRVEEDKNVYYVKDNGVGFDMQYVNKLFGVFQRLHSMEEFEGTGIGLALVQRIILKHGGTVWAEGKVNEGAVFYFTLPGK